jgi:hypothetical protein
MTWQQVTCRSCAACQPNGDHQGLCRRSVPKAGVLPHDRWAKVDLDEDWCTYHHVSSDTNRLYQHYVQDKT